MTVLGAGLCHRPTGCVRRRARTWCSAWRRKLPHPAHPHTDRRDRTPCDRQDADSPLLPCSVGVHRRIAAAAGMPARALDRWWHRCHDSDALGNLSKPSRAGRVRGAPRAGTAVYVGVHEDSEHGATKPSARAAGFESFPLHARVRGLRVRCGCNNGGAPACSRTGPERTAASRIPTAQRKLALDRKNNAADGMAECHRPQCACGRWQIGMASSAIGMRTMAMVLADGRISQSIVGNRHRHAPQSACRRPQWGLPAAAFVLSSPARIL